MSEKEIRTLRRAAAIAGVSVEAMREWCEERGIAKREGRTWVVNRRALMRIVNARRVLGLDK